MRFASGSGRPLRYNLYNFIHFIQLYTSRDNYTTYTHLYAYTLVRFALAGEVRQAGAPSRMQPALLLYYTILYYTILYYAILYCTVLYYTILCYAMLCYAKLYNTILYYNILYIYIYIHVYIYIYTPIILYLYLYQYLYLYLYPYLYHTLLYSTLPCSALLCYTILYALAGEVGQANGPSGMEAGGHQHLGAALLLLIVVLVK